MKFLLPFILTVLPALCFGQINHRYISKGDSFVLKTDSAAYTLFTHSDLLTLEGDTVNTKNIIDKNKITIVILWAWWCAPCKWHFDEFSKRYKSWQKRFNVEIVAIENGFDYRKGEYYKENKIKPLIEKNDWPFTFLYGEGSRVSDFFPETLKNSFFFNKYDIMYPIMLIVSHDIVLDRFEGYHKGQDRTLESLLIKYSSLNTIFKKLNSIVKFN